MLDYIIVALIVLVALAYTVTTLYKKYKRLSDPAGACGHKCDCCPFAKYNEGTAPCSNKKKKSRSSCCCG